MALQQITTNLNFHPGPVLNLGPNLKTQRPPHCNQALPHTNDPIPNAFIHYQQEPPAHHAPDANALVLLLPLMFRQLHALFFSLTLLPKTTFEQFLDNDEIL
jgi:hypothetical protein